MGASGNLYILPTIAVIFINAINLSGAWFFCHLNNSCRFIIFLSSIVIAFIYITCRQGKKINSLQIELGKKEIKHKALSSQFTNKKKTIENYENAINNIMHLLPVAVMRKNDTKITALVEAIWFCFNNIKKE